MGDTMTDIHTASLLKRYCLASLMVAMLAVHGCNRSAAPPSNRQQESGPSMVKIAVGTVRTQLLENVVTLPATIESDETALLMPRVEAYVDRVLVDIGDEVEAGQVLIELSAPELEQEVQEQMAMVSQLRADKQVLNAELESARSQLIVGNSELTLKQSERKRLERLVSSGAIERQRLEEAESAAQATGGMLQKYENAVRVIEAKVMKGESELAVGNARLERARTLASYLEIKAPFAGVVSQRNVDPGNLVRPGNQGSNMKPLLTIAKVDTLRAIFHATTDVAAKLETESPAKFASDDSPDQVFQGKLSRLAGTYSDKTRMMRAEMDLQNTPDPSTGKRSLRAGSYGSITIVLQSATLPVVPITALLQEGQHEEVVVVRNGKCLVTPVEVALVVNDLAGIAEGLAAGDQIILRDPGSIQHKQALKDIEIDVVGW